MDGSVNLRRGAAPEPVWLIVMSGDQNGLTAFRTRRNVVGGGGEHGTHIPRGRSPAPVPATGRNSRGDWIRRCQAIFAGGPGRAGEGGAYHGHVELGSGAAEVTA